MSPAVHSPGVDYDDSFNTPNLLGSGIAMLSILLALEMQSFFFDNLTTVELIAFGTGVLIYILLPLVLLSWLRNTDINMSSEIKRVAHIPNTFSTALIPLGILVLTLLFARVAHIFNVGYRFSYSIAQLIALGIVALALLLSLASLLKRLLNYIINMSSRTMSSVMYSSIIRHGGDKTRAWREIRKTLSLPHFSGVSRTPVREPPAWRLNYKIGSGACGTVFLEYVQTLDMKSPELWAVKRIPQAFPNFTFKRYQAEIKNLEALARVSLSRTHTISQPTLHLCNLH